MTYGVNGPNGFVPVNTGNGNTWNGQTTSYPITSGYSSPIYNGDPVTLSTAGTVIRATASTAVLGIAAGVEYQVSANPYAINFPFWPSGTSVKSGTTAYCRVIDDPRVRFTVQETDASGASGTPLSQAVVGNNITGQSGASIDNASSATTLVPCFKVVMLDPGITLGVASTSGTSGGAQTITAPFKNWIVEVNNDVFKAGSTRP